MRFVSFPATECCTVNRPPHLPAAGGSDGAGSLVRFNAGRMPIQAAKVEYLAYNRLGLGHQGFVADAEQLRWDYSPPVSHQLFVAPIKRSNILQVETVLLTVAKVLEVTGQTGIPWISSHFQKSSIREHACDEPQVAKIRRVLIGYSVGGRSQAG